MLSRRDALKSALVQRRCPPATIKNSDHFQNEFEAHCLVCQFCQTSPSNQEQPLDPGNFTDAIAELGSNFSREFQQDQQPEKSPPLPGDIRILKREGFLWHNGFYYNPPAVMVLNKTPDLEGYLPVAQTFFDPLLAAPGDLMVNDAMFVETWNLYNVKQTSLGAVAGQTGSAVAGDVKAMHSNGAFLPDWACSLVPLKKEDPRRFFRKIERETAEFFNENPTSPALFHFLDRTKLVSDLENCFSGIQWATRPEEIWELLATAEMPDEFYPKAAADNTCLFYHAKLYIYEKGEIKEVRSVRAEADCIEDNDGVSYSIFFPELPVVEDNVWAYSYLKITDRKIIAPETIKTGIKDRSAFFRFKTGSCDTGSLQTALFCHI